LALTTTARFRLLQFNVHLLVEAEAATALQGGVQGLAIRVAKAVNRVLRRRGRVWGDTTPVRSPRRARCATRSCTCCRTGESTSPASLVSILVHRPHGSVAGESRWRLPL